MRYHLPVSSYLRVILARMFLLPDRNIDAVSRSWDINRRRFIALSQLSASRREFIKRFLFSSQIGTNVS